MSTEFSRYFDVSLLQRQEADYELEATQAESKALAKRFGVHDLNHLKAVIHVQPKGKALELRGQFHAKVDWYPSKETLEKQDLCDEFEETIIIMPSAIMEKQDKTDDYTNDQDDLDLEMVAADSTLDLGEIVAQYLGLALHDLTSTSDEEVPLKPNQTKLGDIWPKKD